MFNSLRFSIVRSVIIALVIALADGLFTPAFSVPETTPMDMIEMPAGHFSCGWDGGGWDQQPVHEVTISHSFRVAARSVSNAQYERFSPSHHAKRGLAGTRAGDDDPVCFVDWNEANDYCRWLSRREGKSYRLPTEAEWEYAFRTSPLAFSDRREVENWCLDWYGPYLPNRQTDPVGYTDGDVRAVRGGSWQGAANAANGLAALSIRLGAMPADRNPLIGLRVVEAQPPAAAPLTKRPTPRWAQAVEQAKWNWRPAVDRTQPLFATPISYINLPAGAHGPLFSRHNHDPALVACANGDLLAIWYSCNDESGRELTIAAARLRQGHEAWDDADLFWDVPGRDDHAPALWADRAGTLYHFNGQASGGGWQDLALILRASHDNGRTWTAARFLEPDRAHGNQPIPSPFKAQDGSIYLPCDATPESKGGSVLHVSRDGGTAWSVINKGAAPPVFAAGQSGAWIAGIHAGIDQWTDGSFVAVGRGDTIDGHLAMSVSRDGGHSWHYSATPFPPIGSGQRPVLRRLREGALLLISFTPGLVFANALGQDFTGHGMFAALSYDGGKTWPVRKLLTDGKTHRLNGRGWTGEFTMDGTHAEPSGYLAATQSPDGMIHLVSSGVYYCFNLAWLKQPNKDAE